MLGRGVEKAFLGSICQYAQRSGARQMRGEFIPSAKNAQTEKFYETCGFTAAPAASDSQFWLLDLPAAQNLIPQWIALHVAPDPIKL